MEEKNKPAAQPQCEPVAKNKPVAKLHAERLTGKDGEYGITVEDSQWFNTCRLTGGIFNLYAEQPAPVAVVLPPEDNGNYDYGGYNEGHKDGWNDCLEEVIRLNSTRPTHANPPPGTEPSGSHPHNDGLDEMRKPAMCDCNGRFPCRCKP